MYPVALLLPNCQRTTARLNDCRLRDSVQPDHVRPVGRTNQSEDPKGSADSLLRFRQAASARADFRSSYQPATSCPPLASRRRPVGSGSYSRPSLPSHLNGGGKRARTADPLLAKQVLYQLSYTPSGFSDQWHDLPARTLVILAASHLPHEVVGLSGVEPLTSRLSGVRSNQLSYRPVR